MRNISNDLTSCAKLVVDRVKMSKRRMGGIERVCYKRRSERKRTRKREREKNIERHRICIEKKRIKK